MLSHRQKDRDPHGSAPAEARHGSRVIVAAHMVEVYAALGFRLVDEPACGVARMERPAARVRAEAIYQELHPETKAGVAQAAGANKAQGRGGQVGHNAPRFDEAAAEATGQSERSVRRDVSANRCRK